MPADQLPECGPLLPDSLSPPPKAVVAAVFQVTGLENYTCIDGRWALGGCAATRQEAASLLLNSTCWQAAMQRPAFSSM